MATPAQKSLVEAFNQLVQERPFDDIHVADIIKRADVSRSTFYEHFASREALLRHSLAAVLSPIAEACCGESNCRNLRAILEHFHDLRPVISVYFRSPLLEVVELLLCEQISSELDTDILSLNERKSAKLVCRQLAASNLGLIKAWLEDPQTANVETVANQIIVASKAIRQIQI